MAEVSFESRVDFALGVVRVAGTSIATPASLAEALDALLDERQAELPQALETRRKECRDILRHGKFKPTGRSKPASEYLLRAAREGSFPRINGLVDANNLVSLKTLMPISLWDVERAGGRHFVFRHGEEEQRYVFNPAGHEMDLRDLACGGEEVDGVWTPRVNPVKDSMATKTRDETTDVAGAIYAPLSAVEDGTLDAACRELVHWLGACAAGETEDFHAVLPPGQDTR